MDSFDLHWPHATATLYTDGAHLKIVVRDKRGPSGTVNNIELCKERVAFGLDFAPGLLADLKARGYGDLADDIEQRAVATEAEIAQDPVADWLDSLPGDGDWQACGTKRAAKWHQLAEDLFFKLPAKRGKQEWALKETHADDKPTYVCAPEFKGLLSSLRDRGPDFFAGAISACAEFATEHAEIELAVAAWPKH